MKRNLGSYIASILCNGAIVVLIVAFTLSLRKGLIVEPVKAGFFCGDTSIQYPEKHESVSTNVLIVVGVLSVLVITGIIEFFNQRNCAIEKKSSCCGVNGANQWFINAVRNFLMFLLGLCITALLVELGKAYSGVLRPNFLAVCNPNITCSDQDPFKYHINYRCQNTEDGDCRDCRKSFPSGHAAVVAFMAFFICLYLQNRPQAFKRCFLVRPLLQLIAACLAWVTSLTRVSDHVHHVSDVIVGFVLGIVIAIWTLRMANEANQMYSNNQEVKANDPQDISLKSYNASVKESVNNHNPPPNVES